MNIPESTELILTPLFDPMLNDVLYLSNFSLASRELQEFLVNCRYPVLVNLNDIKLERDLKFEKQYDSLFKFIKNTLQKELKISRNDKYWQTILTPWLEPFFNQFLIYDYLISEAFLRLKKDTKPFIQIVLPKAMPTINTTHEFVKFSKSDFGAHYIMSRIIDHKYRDRYVRLNEQIADAVSKKWNGSSKVGMFRRVKSRFGYLVTRTLNYINKSTKRKFVLIGPIFPGIWLNLLFFVQTKFKAVPFWINDEKFDNYKERKQLKNIDLNSVGNFSLIELVALDLMPTAFFSSFNKLNSELAWSLERNNVAGIIGSSEWYYSEAFKFIAAEGAQRKIPQVGVQHGGNYGIQKNHPIFKSEVELRDYYISWGFVSEDLDNHFNARIFNLGSCKLFTHRKRKQKKYSSKILFAGSEMPRYPRWVGKNDFDIFSKRLQSQKQFFDALDDQLLSKTFFRGNPIDFGWGQIQTLCQKFPQLKRDHHKKQFQVQLDNTKLYVSNNLSTTFTEALSRNIPTILFWEDDPAHLHKESRTIFRLLREVKILHRSGENAAVFVNHNFGDLSSWWGSDTVQDARREICCRFFKSSNEVSLEWRAFLDMLTASGKS